MSKLLFSDCKQNLAKLWFIGSAIIFIILITQTIGDIYADKEEAWEWFLPIVMPTLSLMVGVFIADVTNESNTDKSVAPFMYKLTYILSLSYLLLVLVTICLHPLSSDTPIEYLKASDLWLNPLQWLTTALLGAFFIKQA